MPGDPKEPCMRPIPLREIPSRRSAPLDDAAMEQHVRSLAVSLNPDGHAALKMCARSAVRAPLENARALSPQRDALPASLEWLLENGRLTESFLQAQCLPNPTRLPAANGLPRIQHLMQFLVSHSDASISSERLQRCLSAFDEVRALTMDELWAVPAALAAALCREYIHAANTAVITGRDQCAALSWLEEGAPVSSSLLRRSAAFFECALRRMHEETCPPSIRRSSSGCKRMTGRRSD